MKHGYRERVILYQIELVINSYPLTPLSDDHTNLNAFTAGYFLILLTLTAATDKCYIEAPDRRLNMFEKLQKIVQQFWTRWIFIIYKEVENGKCKIKHN